MKKDSLLNFLSLAWVYLIMLQVLRLEYGKFYLPIFLAFALLNIFLIIRSGYIFLPVSYVSLNIWIFYILMIFMSAMTFFYGNLTDFLKAFPRMLVMPLTAFFLFNLIKKKKTILSNFKHILIFWSIRVSKSSIPSFFWSS